MYKVLRMIHVTDFYPFVHLRNSWSSIHSDHKVRWVTVGRQPDRAKQRSRGNKMLKKNWLQQAGNLGYNFEKQHSQRNGLGWEGGVGALLLSYTSCW